MVYNVSIENMSLDRLYVHLTSQVPVFWSLALIFEFIVLALVVIVGRKKLSGEEDVFLSITYAALITTISSWFMLGVGGLLPGGIAIPVTWTVFTFICMIIVYFMDRDIM